LPIVDSNLIFNQCLWSYHHHHCGRAPDWSSCFHKLPPSFSILGKSPCWASETVALCKFVYYYHHYYYYIVWWPYVLDQRNDSDTKVF